MPYSELRDLTPGATAESVALRFAEFWRTELEWIERPTRFLLGRTAFRVRLRGLAWEVIEDTNGRHTDGELAYRLAAGVRPGHVHGGPGEPVSRP
jgi:hypothetical protein